MSKPKLYFDADMNNPRAVAAQGELVRAYHGVETPTEADIIVCLGGDGKMLKSMQLGMALDKPVYGMNLGHIGALLNSYSPISLIEYIEDTVEYKAPALKAVGQTQSGEEFELFAFNEVAFKNLEPSQCADLNIVIGSETHHIRGDGFLVATPQGSGAYNKNAGGHVLSLKDRLLVATSICSDTPLRKIMPYKSYIYVAVNNPDKRPILVNADHTRKDNVSYCTIEKSKKSVTILFGKIKATLMQLNCRE